ncbi:hypothetical protein [Chryseobacterium nepalense]|uniref:Uncharacterized protein n=1 Tax=Chryseobacterium nepalense TaxID=1854498 RepID=A0ABY4K667_9FLAO|nr:hypothetical protein [Chryseobacterium nepalense]UPQ76049.1 hypothetical protein M0D58_00560 [Chryseobacterium nepalense]
MIISWNTDPSKGTFAPGSTKYSSYYQYDTVSHKFVRIRLELGRGGSDGGDTGSFYRENRYVGFTTDNDLSTDIKRWSVDDGQLRYELEKDEYLHLPTEPKTGATTYDTSFGNVKNIHRGNPVTSDPHFPEGIQNKHLGVLANEAILGEKGIVLTSSAASGAELSAVLKGQVAKVVGKTFNEITNEDLLKTLQRQVAQIKQNEILPSKENINSSLEEADGLIDSIKEQITDEGMVPTEEFSKSYSNFIEKYMNANAAVESGIAVKSAMEEFQAAKNQLMNESKTIEAAYYNNLETQLNNTNTAVDAAVADATTWENIDLEYENLEKANSIEEYEAEIGVEETEVL